MPKQPEQILEEQLVAQLQKLGYGFVQLKDEKDLLANLKQQLEKHNNISFSAKEFERVLNILSKGSVFEKAKTLRERQHIVKDNGDNLYFEFIQTEHWCQNEFQVTHQVSMEGTYKNRYDVTLLINGLPLVQIELKRRGLELKEAFNQVKTYIILQAYNLITIIIVLTATFGYINFRFIKLPATIGIMLISLVASLFVIAIGHSYPEIFRTTTSFISSVDFDKALMNVMLSFLLFAGAIHIDIHELREQRTSVITFSTIGVLISTIIVAALLYVVTGWLSIQIDFIYCLLFGALISPTDPIAVLGILKEAKIPASLEMKISGESLFNDGVAVVIFLTILEIINVGIQNVSAGQIAWLFIKEAGGGILFGWLLGYIGFLALRSVDRYILEVGITLAIVMGWLFACRLFTYKWSPCNGCSRYNYRQQKQGTWHE